MAAAPILLAAGGALNNPKVDPQKTREALHKLGIPTTGTVMVTIAYQGCGTHDFITMEKAAKSKGAKLYAIYGFPEDPIAHEAEKQNKLSISVVKEPRSLDATLILRKADRQILTRDEIIALAPALGLTLNRQGGGISSNGSALIENGVLKGVIADKEMQVRTGFIPTKPKGAAALA